MRDELLPCPFCGSVPEYELYPNEHERITCHGCQSGKDCFTILTELWPKGEGVRRWNTRATTENSLAVQLSTILHLIRTHPFSSISDREAMMKGLEASEGKSVDEVIARAVDRINAYCAPGHKEEIIHIIREELYN